MRWRKLRMLLRSAILIPWLLSSAHAALTVNEVAREFVCNCGCNKVLPECDMACGEQLRGIIKAKLGEGWDKPRIVRFMVENYGEKLLAAPTKAGFNLTAWITPFLALFAGAGIIGVVIRRWRRRTSRSTSDADSPAKEYLEQRYGARLEEEMKRFE